MKTPGIENYNPVDMEVYYAKVIFEEFYLTCSRQMY